MIEWHWLWALWLLPLPIIMRLIPAVKRDEAALKVPSFTSWQHDFGQYQVGSTKVNFAWLLPCLIWAGLVVALARPSWLGDVVELPVSGRDLMMAVDISGSMEIKDMEINGKAVDRLSIVKEVLNDFIDRREGDRLGLILFGSNAYLQTPLTFDRETVRTFLNEAALGLAGKKTAIGDAIALAAKRLESNPAESRVLVLLTDGANTAGEIEPVKAAELAAQMGIRIHTIGLGADSMEVTSFFGSQRVNPSRDLDEDSLRKIADLTGGKFFRARNTGELEEIYTIIDQLEPTEKDPEIYRPQTSLYQWPLLAALILSLIQGVFSSGVLSRFNSTKGGAL